MVNRLKVKGETVNGLTVKRSRVKKKKTMPGRAVNGHKNNAEPDG